MYLKKSITEIRRAAPADSPASGAGPPGGPPLRTGLVATGEQPAAWIVLLSAVCTGCLAWAGNAVLSFLGGLNLNLYLAVVLAALLIFALPSLLLGMVSPFVIRLAKIGRAHV